MREWDFTEGIVWKRDIIENKLYHLILTRFPHIENLNVEYRYPGCYAINYSSNEPKDRVFEWVNEYVQQQENDLV